ncbi:MAG: dTDP-4-dehydrorhamnose reductase [Pseudomonadota bacterium]|jgi:dTDP-4-dehydrorhamnose reductase
MKILLFGGSGQLGFELKKRAADLNFTVVSPVTKEIDITEGKQVANLVVSLKPDVVINSAAYTQVDKAEEESERAFAVNAEGVRYVAEACARADTRLIHISTDYVFDGLTGRPLREDDPVNPVSVYGRSKLMGEQFVAEILGDRGLVVRTQALYGQKGVNFVHTMLKLFTERPELKIVDDQFVSPTWAGWLAEAVLDLARLKVGGTLHASCSGVVSWYGFAVEIQRLAADKLGTRGVDGCQLARIERTTAAELNRPAKRPVFSAFDTSKIAQVLRRQPLSWEVALQQFLIEIGLHEER